MRITLDASFFEERSFYSLSFGCESCAHFDAERQRCAHGWPIEEHLEAAYEREARSELVFCKEFELD